MPLKVYIGLIGNYRTFEQTYKSLFINLIDANPSCNFDIYINTEVEEGIINDKWKRKNHIKTKYNKYTKEDLDLLFKKNYKSNLKQITYLTIKRRTPWRPRIKKLINDYKNTNNNSYDLFFFMRIDCVFLNKLNILNYANKLDNNIVKMICRDIIVPDRFDHDRDWDMGVVSKNIDNIYKFVSYDYQFLTTDDSELEKLLKKIKCNGIFTKYNLPLPRDVEIKYKNGWHYRNNCATYSFNKLIGPLWYEDEFFLSILR